MEENRWKLSKKIDPFRLFYAEKNHKDEIIYKMRSSGETVSALDILNESKKKDMFYVENIEQQTLKNDYFRKVVWTVEGQFQLVLMTLKPGQNIGSEVHPKTTQFVRVESGTGYAELNGIKFPITDGSAVIVEPNTQHDFVNLSEKEDMKMYVIYTPPEHKPGEFQIYK